MKTKRLTDAEALVNSYLSLAKGHHLPEGNLRLAYTLLAQILKGQERKPEALEAQKHAFDLESKTPLD